MKNRTLATLAAALAVTCLSAAAEGARANPAGATEPTQITNMIQLIDQAQNMISQLRALRAQLQTLRYNTQRMAAGSWDIRSRAMERLGELQREFQSHAFNAESFAEDWASTHPGNVGWTDYSSQYRALRMQNLNSARRALRMIGTLESEMDNDRAILDRLRQQGQSAGGQRQAIEAGNMLAAETVRQLNLMRATHQSHQRLQAEQEAAAEQRRAHQDAELEERLRYHNLMHEPVDHSDVLP